MISIILFPCLSLFTIMLVTYQIMRVSGHAYTNHTNTKGMFAKLLLVCAQGTYVTSGSFYVQMRHLHLHISEFNLGRFSNNEQAFPIFYTLLGIRNEHSSSMNLMLCTEISACICPVTFFISPRVTLALPARPLHYDIVSLM